jgi:hypothetical protein
MDVCREQVPPLFRVHSYQAASCFLHKEAPVVSNEQMSEALAPRKAAASPA